VEEAPSERTRVKRYHWLAKYDRATVHSILDAMPMCYVGYSFDNAPYVTPTMRWREGERVFWHGSSASRMLRAVEKHNVAIDEASAKVRVGQPEDDEADYAVPVWAGVIPIRYEILPPIADPKNLEGVTMPEDVLKFRIG
jgi:Pyridoxamine 5'-phosphate oxidase